MNPVPVSLEKGRGEKMKIVEVDATGLSHKGLNDKLREHMLAGVDKIVIRNVYGQRYIGTRLYSPGSDKKLEIEVFGTPGSDLAAFMTGHYIRIHGNVQDGIGNTMDDGSVIVEGRGGDVVGMSMRGGRIFIRDNVGYRAALHMKEYMDKKPVLVIGGTSQDFLGEYMAGGIVILLGLGDKPLKANFIGTGMHGGVIYLRGCVDRAQVAKEVDISGLENGDAELLDKCVGEFVEEFPELNISKEDILKGEFSKLMPLSKRPYAKMYAY